jgi:alpha-galactosidase
MKLKQGMLREWSSSPLVFALICTIILITPLFASGGTRTIVYAESNGLALTPPMGFNDWNAFACNVTEAKIKQAADFIVSSGLKTLGYNYVNVDDCWMASSRDSKGNLVADAKKFPAGIKALADYVHKDGLLFGIYEGAGTKTCKGLPGSYKHETHDASIFASWGVDYLKYDWCSGKSVPFGDFSGQSHDQVAQTLYTRMSNALNASGRSIVFSMCNGSDSSVHPSTWGGAISNLWRTTPDITATWSHIYSNYTKNVALYAKAGPGHWNDPDMLEIGNGTLTQDEQKTHLSLWAEMAAPLLIGTNLLTASTTTLNILKTQPVIAVDQDSLGVQGHVVATSGGGLLQVLAKKLSNGDVSVVLFNADASTKTITTSASVVGLPAKSSYILENLWAGGARTTTTGTISASVPSHGVVMYRVHP